MTDLCKILLLCCDCASPGHMMNCSMLRSCFLVFMLHSSCPAVMLYFVKTFPTMLQLCAFLVAMFSCTMFCCGCVVYVLHTSCVMAMLGLCWLEMSFGVA